MNLWNRLSGGLASRLRNWIFRLSGMTLDGYCWLQAVEVPRFPWRIHLGEGVALDRGVVLLVSGEADGSPAIRIGARTYINRHTFLDASRWLEIGQGCLIGPFCYLTDHDHGAEGDRSRLVERPTIVEDGVWMGAHVTVLKGVRIGRGAVVGAGSVVTCDVPPGTTVVGNPARVVERKES